MLFNSIFDVCLKIFIINYFNLQVSVQAFNDEDPQGRRTLGNVLINGRINLKNFLSCVFQGH